MEQEDLSRVLQAWKYKERQVISDQTAKEAAKLYNDDQETVSTLERKCFLALKNAFPDATIIGSAPLISIDEKAVHTTDILLIIKKPKVKKEGEEEGVEDEFLEFWIEIDGPSHFTKDVSSDKFVPNVSTKHRNEFTEEFLGKRYNPQGYESLFLPVEFPNPRDFDPQKAVVEVKEVLRKKGFAKVEASSLEKPQKLRRTAEEGGGGVRDGAVVTDETGDCVGGAGSSGAGPVRKTEEPGAGKPRPDSDSGFAEVLVDEEESKEKAPGFRSVEPKGSSQLGKKRSRHHTG